MGNTVRVDQTVVIFSGTSNDMKQVNWSKLDGLSSVHDGLIAIARQHWTRYNAFSHIMRNEHMKGADSIHLCNVSLKQTNLNSDPAFALSIKILFIFLFCLNLCDGWPDYTWLGFAILLDTNNSQNSWFKITDSCFQTLYQLPTSQYNPWFTLHESFHSLSAAAGWAIPALPSFPWHMMC